MIDSPAVLKSFLADSGYITILTGDRIWAERTDPVPGYKPGDGPALVFKSRGGNGDYTGALLNQSWQFKCYGLDEEAANVLYRTLVDVLHEKQAWPIMWSELEVAGQTLVELEPPWIYVLTYFTTRMILFPA